MPVSEERLGAAEIASSLMSTPVTVAPSKTRLKESPPELHCRWASVLPDRSPSSARSSGKRVLPPSRRYPARSPRWLSCAPTTAFQESRFCSRRSLRSTGGFYLLTRALRRPLRHDFLQNTQEAGSRVLPAGELFGTAAGGG